jgi:transcriptional regulator GlxA family with amidase domain
MCSIAASLPNDEDSLRVLDPRIGDALRFMDANLQCSLAVGDVAKKAGLSPSRFAHLFQVETGSSPARMLLRLRLERAAELLCTTGLPLKEVGVRAGMAHLSAFGRAFRAWYGMTPSEFRRNNRLRSHGRSLLGSAAGIVK